MTSLQMNSLKIDIDNLESDNLYTFNTEPKTSDFLDELKNTLAELYKLPIEQVREMVRSDEFKDDHDLIYSNFWKEFKCISKDDCSLDCAILLQHFGFNLHRDFDA